MYIKILLLDEGIFLEQTPIGKIKKRLLEAGYEKQQNIAINDSQISTQQA